MITQYKAANPLDPTSQAEYKLLAGGATRTWVGTEDAYNAEKNNIPNNTMICITDDNMDVDTYSTSEVKTNKVWIDGKPIYRKAGIYNNGETIGTEEVLLDSILTTSYVDTVIATGGSAMHAAITMVNIGGYSHDQYRLCLAIDNRGLIKLTSDSTYTKFKWWIEYTKTAG